MELVDPKMEELYVGIGSTVAAAARPVTVAAVRSTVVAAANPVLA